MTRASRPRGRFGRAVRLLVAAIALLAGLELALAVAAHLAGKSSGVALHGHYGWKTRANVARSGAMWGAERPAQTNRFGWRDRERSLAPEPGVRRIVVVGDSFTFGVGADDGDRFTEWIERSSPGVEVLNLGVNGFGTDQELRVLEEEGLAFDPDVVVCATYLGNDLGDIVHSQQHRWPKPHYVVEGESLRLVPPPIHLWHRVRSATYVGEVLELAAGRLGWKPRARRVAWEDPIRLYLAIVDAMRQASAAAGADFAVLLVWEPTIAEGVRVAVLEGLAERAIPAIDLEPAFRPAMASAEVLFNPPPVAHWNATGHELAGSELARGLRELGWIR